MRHTRLQLQDIVGVGVDDGEVKNSPGSLRLVP